MGGRGLYNSPTGTLLSSSLSDGISAYDRRAVSNMGSKKGPLLFHRRSGCSRGGPGCFQREGLVVPEKGLVVPDVFEFAVVPDVFEFAVVDFFLSCFCNPPLSRIGPAPPLATLHPVPTVPLAAPPTTHAVCSLFSRLRRDGRPLRRVPPRRPVRRVTLRRARRGGASSQMACVGASSSPPHGPTYAQTRQWTARAPACISHSIRALTHTTSLSAAPSTDSSPPRAVPPFQGCLIQYQTAGDRATVPTCPPNTIYHDPWLTVVAPRRCADASPRPDPFLRHGPPAATTGAPPETGCRRCRAVSLSVAALLVL
eukprot:gene6386-3008_t